MNCKSQRQEDENFCHVCGLRWAVDEPRPKQAKCAQKVSEAYEKQIERNMTNGKLNHKGSVTGRFTTPDYQRVSR